nr:Dedicator of cytokinesis protein 9 [Hymenolepis microstoma]
MDKPIEQWYAIDHVITENGADRPVTNSIRTNNRGAIATGAAPSTETSVGSRLWTSARRAALMATHNGTDSESANSSTKASENGMSSTSSPLEADVAVCTRADFQSHQRARDAALASGASEQPLVGVRPRHRLVLRQLSSDDLPRLRLQNSNSSAQSQPSLPLGLHLIVPANWGIQPSSYTAIDCSDIIFLDSIESVSGIGRHWLRLDRRTSTRTYRIASDRFESFFSPSGCNEAYLFFESIDARNDWIGALKNALDAEFARVRLGYSVANGGEGSAISVVNGCGDGSGGSAETRMPDGDSLRSSLQRFSQENELFVSHQRQQHRLDLLSVFPDVQITYSNQLPSDCVSRRHQFADLIDLISPSSNTLPPGIPLSIRSLLPECSRDISKRRFLLTCLSLKTDLRASIEDSSGKSEVDNPEPFFVTAFLASTANDGTRLSEDFCWNPNSPLVEAMFSAEVFRRLPWHTPETQSTHNQPLNHQSGGKVMAPAPPIPLNPHGSLIAPLAKLAKCRSALFSIDPAIKTNNLFLVFRVDKVLVGGISQAAEKYMKATAGSKHALASSDLKTGTTLHKSMQSYCKLLGRYRMPFAWGARWLFSKETQVPLFKVDSSKVSEEALLQSVRQIARSLILSTGEPSGTLSNGSEKSASINPSNTSVLEALEKSLKSEIVPIQFHVAVNEISTEMVSRYLKGLVSTQLVTAANQRNPTGDEPASPQQTLNLLHVNDFSSDEVVKELEIFSQRKVRSLARALNPVLFDGGSIGHSSLRGSIHRGDSKRCSLASIRSDASSASYVSSTVATQEGTNDYNSSGSLLMRFSTSILSKTASLDRGSHIVTEGHEENHSTTEESTATLFSQPPLSLIDPYRAFVHTLYVYPKYLNLSVKHSFGRARNLCCFIELRDSDGFNVKPLKVFYTRPSLLRPPFDSWFNTAVVHHDSNPSFTDEAKLCLPIILTRKHHLLFRFFHIRCDLAANAVEKNTALKKSLESPTGFAWLPVLNDDGSLASGTIYLPISQDLPNGYLNAFSGTSRRVASTAGSNGTSMSSGPEPSWIENKRPLFTVALEPVSTMYSLDSMLSRFFETCVSKLSNFTVPVTGVSSSLRGVRFVTGDDATPVPSRTLSAPDTLPSSQLDTTTGKLLSNAIKSLLSVESHALVQFFPALANQILEVLLVSSAMSQLETTPPSANTDIGHWLALCQDIVSGSPCDVAKNVIRSFSMILCVIKDALSGSSVPSSLVPKSAMSCTTRPDILKNFLEFSLDPQSLYNKISETYEIPPAASSALYLHHAVVRGMVAFMVDPCCLSEIAHPFLLSTWFFFEVIIKSLGQHLSASNSCKIDRKDWGRLSVAFKTDLTILIRLLGNWMVEICSKRDGLEVPGFDTSSTKSDHLSSTLSIYDNQVVKASSFQSKTTEMLGLELADSTAIFFEKLLLLIDRGFVLQRLRDLLSLLEIRHNMAPSEVERFNSLRYRLIQRFSETQFFIQINLPSLSPHLSDRTDEFTLSERFCEEHFIVGLTLQAVACVLAGCADAGGTFSSRGLRQPLLLLLAQLAKVAFDSRYTASSRLRSRIHLLYLPLVKIALENIESLGPPGLQIRELEQVDRIGHTKDDSDSQRDSQQQHHRKSRTSHKLKLHHNGSSQHSDSIKKVTVVGRPENLKTQQFSDGSVSSLSLMTNSTNSSNSETRSTTSGSTTSTAASAFLGPNGKVAPEVLKQIAGFNKGGALQRVAPRRRLPSESKAPAAKGQFGSTSTLTEAGGSNNGDAEEGSENSSNGCYWYSNGNGVRGEEGACDVDYNSDIDENDVAWPERVLEMAGVLPAAKNSIDCSESLPPAPPRHNGAKVRQSAPQLNQPPSQDVFTPTSKSPSTISRFRIQAAQFDYTFRRHIHRRSHAHLLSSQHLNDKCQRDLYICLLQLLHNLSDDPLAALLRSLSDAEKADFLKLLTYAIQHIKYRGRKCISRFNTISTSSVTQRGTLGLTSNSATSDSDYRVLLEANMAAEAGLIILDILNLMCNTFRRDLENGNPSNPIFQGILEVYACLLSTGQSEHLLKHTFASLRVFISRFAKVLFSETTEGLARICMAGLRTSNLNLLPLTGTDDDEDSKKSPITPVSTLGAFTCTVNSPLFDASSASHIGALRLEACGLIYRMWRASFEVFGSQGFKRVHLQIIIALSKLVGSIGPEFESSLSLLHSLAGMDIQRGIRETTVESSYSRAVSDPSALLAPFRGSAAASFMEGIEDLIKRIRTVLTATEEMRRYSNDPYRKIDLQYSLAKSYASNPVLRRTWLEKLAELHLTLKNMAEVAMAKLHIAALMAEYLHKRGEFPQGCDAFCKVSANIRLEETSTLCDPSIIELSYNQEDLLRDVTDAATALEAAGLYEALQPVYALITPVYEARRNYARLSNIYHHLGRAYENIAKAEASAQRLFATYFRVTFFGKAFEGLAGKSYVYRAEAWQKINIFLQNQVRIHEERLGVGKVEKIIENYIDPSRLSPEKAYIQVTFIEPYVPMDSSTQLAAFDRHHDVREFFFETPFIMQPGMTADECLTSSGPKRTEDLTAQWKRRTLVTTKAVFPHLRSRLEIVSIRDIDLSPLDAAIDAIQLKVCELTAYIPCAPQETANVSALHLSTTKNQRGICVTTASSPSLEVLESGVELTAKGECRVPLILDMQLQGALLPTVNQGPMAYAHAFLDPERIQLHPKAKINKLKHLFFEFLTACLVILTRYRSLMLRVHPEKYNALKEAFNRYRVDLSNLLNEEIVVDEASLQVGPKSQFAGAPESALTTKN